MNETRKGLLLIWDYKFNMITQMIMVGFIFIGISFMMGGGNFDPEQLSSALLGYVIWFFAVLVISDLSWNLQEETQTGTLEQMYMSSVSLKVIVMGRTFARLIVSIVMVSVITVILIMLMQIRIPFRWQGFPILALTLVGLYGFGFMIAGLTLIYKHVQSLANFVTNALLFLNGALLPVDKLPGFLQAITKTLPTTQGIIVLRNVILHNQSLAEAWSDSSLTFLLIHSILYFTAGMLFFEWCERTAKRQGTFGQY
jgi:ABC-2 type transport system permease protein